MLAEELGRQERSNGVRGNVFSFLMPREDIQLHMDEVTNDEALAAWPHPPGVLCHLVRLVLTSANAEMLSRILELKVRAHVLLGLGRLHIQRHHADCVGKGAAAVIIDRAARLRRYREVFERHYPQSIYGCHDGAVPPEIIASIQGACI